MGVQGRLAYVSRWAHRRYRVLAILSLAALVGCGNSASSANFCQLFAKFEKDNNEFYLFDEDVSATKIRHALDEIVNTAADLAEEAPEETREDWVLYWRFADAVRKVWKDFSYDYADMHSVGAATVALGEISADIGMTDPPAFFARVEREAAASCATESS